MNLAFVKHSQYNAECHHKTQDKNNRSFWTVAFELYSENEEL